MRKLVLLILILLVPAGSAQGVTLVDSQGKPIGGKWQQWANHAYVPTAQRQVVLDLTGCPTHDGSDCADSSFVGIDPTDDTPHDSLLHELGHVYDFTTLTDVQRLRFMQLWRVPQHPGLSVHDNWWYGEDHLSDWMWRGQKPAGEWFAEGYRLCALHPRWNANVAYNIWMNDPNYGSDTSVPGYQYHYPASWSMWANPEGNPTPRRLRHWAIRAQRGTCHLIRHGY